MASILYKWLLVFSLAGFYDNSAHPIFVSVTEIEHNAGDKTLEISCKMFTDDFETTLRKLYNTKVDLLNVEHKTAMSVLVNDYVQKHLILNVNGKNVSLQFAGYEQQEEGILCYYQVNNVAAVKKLMITDNILYEFQPQQINIIHVMVNGNRQSFKLINPEAEAKFLF